MLNLNNFILPFKIREEWVKVLDNTDEALLVKTKSGEPFFVSKLAIIPPKKDDDIYVDSKTKAVGTIRFTPVGFTPVGRQRVLPYTNYIPYYSITGDIPPLLENPFRRRTSIIPNERLEDVEKLVDYLLGLKRPDWAFSLSFLYLYRPKSKKQWHNSSKSMQRVIWEGVPHISDMYFIDRKEQTLLVPKHSPIYRAISSWWGISGGYHNRRRKFFSSNIEGLYKLCNSIYSPFIQCKVENLTLQSFFSTATLSALLKTKKERFIIPKEGVIYNNCIYLNDVPFYYTLRDNRGEKPKKIWWDHSWYESIKDYMDPALFASVKALRMKELVF